VNGSIDRIDRFADGRLAVIDYKSGSSRNYTGVSHDNPIQHGQLLQLPIYAHAARAFLGDGSREPVQAEYWFVLRDLTNPRGYAVDTEVESALDAALGVIVTGIDAGYFPARPPEPGFTLFTECEYCDPDGLGTADTHRAWLRKRAVPELADYRALIGDGSAAP
jgi:RecB family exonuclease